MRVALFIKISAVLVLCAGCSWQSRDSVVEAEVTLADLQPAIMPMQGEDLPTLSLEEISALYQEVLTVNRDPATERLVRQRLAALQMMRSEQQLAEGVINEALFADTIDAYQQLLITHPQGPINDSLQYQLSKAYALSGDTEQSLAILAAISDKHPQSSYVGEAEFRKAEHAFVTADYRQAAKSYRRVMTTSELGSSYYQKSLYMYGWSLFKLNQFEQARDAFVAVLDLTLPADGSLAGLSRAEKELVNDCFRVLAVSFSYLDGVGSIETIAGGLAAHPYLADLYASLAALYLSQERYQDSANVYRRYIERYPDTDRVHAFFVSAIAMYEKAGFIDDVRREKKHYVALFATDGNYWLSRSAELQQVMAPQLKAYLIELARYHHGMAQKIKSQQAITQTKKVQQQKTSSALPQLSSSTKSLTVDQHYDLAGDYYLQYLSSFPTDDNAAQLHFLLAESRFEAERYTAAIKHYEIVAYQFSHDDNAADAGYAALLSYSQLLGQQQSRPENQLSTGGENNLGNEIQLQKIASELRFAKQFSDDPRAVSVLSLTSESLLAIGDYPRAINAAEQLTQWPTPLANNVELDAWLVIAQATYNSGDYFYAESAYLQAQQRLPANDKRRPAVNERVAASIYKQGELALAKGDLQLASEQYLRVLSTAPQSTVRVNAQYDAATQLLALQQWQPAIDLLVDFRQRFANHQLVAGISEKLLVAYQALQQWQLAADELMLLFVKEPAPDKQAELLFYAAELYQRSGDTDNAIEHYRRYAHQYRLPLATNMEAMYQLSELYLVEREGTKRRFWLNKMIAADAAAGSLRTARSRYLAAFSTAVLADDAYQNFSTISLTLPLKKSMKKKKSAMQTTVQRYQQLNDYQLEAFSTLAAFRLAEIYAQLSRDLIASERPANLDELAMEQYEVLLEEQAFPFEEKSIELHEINSQRSWQGVYNDSVKQSFESLEVLLPARYRKPEKIVDRQEVIY